MTRVYEHAAMKVGIELTVMDCARCGVVFGISTQLEQRRREDGQAFYCPNGHSNVFKDSELDKTKRELERVRGESQRRLERFRDEQAAHDATMRTLSATKGQVTKLKKRVHNGVCPYCQRHFTALQRHIETKHHDELATP